MAIIGVSGKINSGKDTVGRIIQYLIARKNDNRSIKIQTAEFLGLTSQNWMAIYRAQDWEIKKFADKLKDIVCILIGCTREQLENRKFKEKELGEEWDKYQLDSHWLNDDNVEHITSEYFNSIEELNQRISEWNMSEQTYTIQGLIKLTPRKLLQLIGTDLLRNQLHENTWVNALMSKYKINPIINFTNGEHSNIVYPNWIITDMRFPNELKAVKDRGGITIRINRPYSTVVGQGNGNWATFSDTQFHPSETSLDSATFDFIINNDRDIEHLINEVKKILEKSNII